LRANVGDLRRTEDSAVIHVRGKGGEDRRGPDRTPLVEVLYLDSRATRFPPRPKSALPPPADWPPGCRTVGVRLDRRCACVEGVPNVDFKLEVVVLPVSDVDRSKRFYEALGFRLDADFPGDDGFRVVQLTPPGSPASIIFGSGVTAAAPGSVQGLYLVVSDIQAARDDLVGRGVDVSEVYHDAGSVFEHAGTDHRRPGPDPNRGSYASFASFSDPDGNGWVLQEVTQRLLGR
jgi:catechol 2,3-dioxygenase-like lactoylglutathione lyase family enzyme